ncbi:rho GTPase-activating protein 22 isoform X2 [Hemicordylus capensis]|uniref:rho GTPase-activating protein 22 isoform X2 n=1 Tax=Hemicordylus capensis TaxID=884348 RepID=UPI002303BF06|nr:rho GTPase-activating protein 22 isoform X2 [Hemicordylus capensis]
MANSQNDMEDWVKAIRRIICAPSGRGITHSPYAHNLNQFPPGIFGQRLEDTVQHEKCGQHLAPLLVEQCVDFIREHGLTEEGLFRMPGQASLVKDLQHSFDCGEKPLFDRNTDVHTVASLLKLYLRELPEPVIPFATYEDFLSCGKLLSKDKEEGTQELTKQVKNLPQVNFNLLKYICKFLDEVQSHSSLNKMSVQNLATVFGPNILRPQIEDPVTIMEGTSLIQHLMTVLISEHRKIFGDSPAKGSGVQLEAHCYCPHGAIDWISKESKLENLLFSPISLPKEAASSADKATIQECNRKGNCNQPATSSNKKGQTLPDWKCPFRQQGIKSLNPKLGSSSLDIPSLPASGNWLMNGLYSLQGYHGTSSAGQVKVSGSSQRLSTYDNVPTSSFSLSTLGSTSTTWSSCEISVSGDSVSSGAACRASDSSALSSLQMEWVTHSPLPQHAGYLDNSMEKPEACFSSSSDPSNLAAASKDSAHCSGNLQSLIAELKAKLSKQRTAYESSIKRIEETNTELRKQMTRLEEELNQEKKKYVMLEIKLRNSERAREDADKRNHLLQEEMEDFFATLGNLTGESQVARAPK